MPVEVFFRRCRHPRLPSHRNSRSPIPLITMTCSQLAPSAAQPNDPFSNKRKTFCSFFFYKKFLRRVGVLLRERRSSAQRNGRVVKSRCSTYEAIIKARPNRPTPRDPESVGHWRRCSHLLADQTDRYCHYHRPTTSTFTPSQPPITAADKPCLHHHYYLLNHTFNNGEWKLFLKSFAL